MSVNKALQDAMDYLKTQPTGVVADAIGKIKLTHQGCMGLLPIRGFEDSHIAGPVVTIKFSPVRPTGYRKPISFFEIVGEFPAGSIICTQIAEHMTTTGDNEAQMAKNVGVIGMIIDGSPRDVAGIRKVGLPIWSKCPATRKRGYEWELTAYNVPINLAGVQVHPGDFAVADEDGAIIVPREVLVQTAELAKYAAVIETELEEANNRGASLKEIAAIYERKSAYVPLKLNEV
jgi:regulator of RNase E activity RraA